MGNQRYSYVSNGITYVGELETNRRTTVVSCYVLNIRYSKLIYMVYR